MSNKVKLLTINVAEVVGADKVGMFNKVFVKLDNGLYLDIATLRTCNWGNHMFSMIEVEMLGASQLMENLSDEKYMKNADQTTLGFYSIAKAACCYDGIKEALSYAIYVRTHNAYYANAFRTFLDKHPGLDADWISSLDTEIDKAYKFFGQIWDNPGISMYTSEGVREYAISAGFIDQHSTETAEESNQSSVIDEDYDEERLI